MILGRDLYQHHGYVKGLLVALRVVFTSTLKNLLRIEKPITVAYPEEKYYYSDRFRGLPYLTVKEDGELRCTSCRLCESYCPAECIHIDADPIDDPREGKTPVSFQLEVLRCVFCGLCAEVCPVDAIRMGAEYELAGHAEQEWLLDHHQLAFRPSLGEGKGIVSVVDDRDRQALRL